MSGISVDPWLSLAGVFVGFVVGLTGMGGGALMTPILVLFFGVEPLAAVSSDIVASAVMKPVGGSVHWKHGTVHKGLVRWLVMGSVPSAFVGVWALRKLARGESLQSIVKHALGIALLIVSSAIIFREVIKVKRAKKHEAETSVIVRKLPTLVIGILGGLVVGMTSVGSGSLMMVLILLLYPSLRLKELVGTDLVQAVPLVLSASAAHFLFGDFKLGLTLSILIGALPGVYLGAKVSARAPDYLIRPALVAVLSASGLKLVGLGSLALGVAAVLIGVGCVAWYVVAVKQARSRPGVPLEPGAFGASLPPPPTAELRQLD